MPLLRNRNQPNFPAFSSDKPHENISPINLSFIYRDGCDFVEFFVDKYRPPLNRHVLATWLPKLCQNTGSDVRFSSQHANTWLIFLAECAAVAFTLKFSIFRNFKCRDLVV